MDQIFDINEIDKIVETAVEWWANAILKDGKVQPEELERFKQALSSKVKTSLALNNYTTLFTDSYPEDQLAEIAFETKINGAVFPKKTFMDITLREVGVRQNFGNRKLLYATQKN